VVEGSGKKKRGKDDAKQYNLRIIGQMAEASVTLSRQGKGSGQTVEHYIRVVYKILRKEEKNA
jgi:hypothetical protein